MPYPEIMIAPMREDLTRLGVEELRTPDAVDETIKNSNGTLMVVVNSICGCAAGKARPGVALALQNERKPDKVATVFAGADIEATERARSYFTGYGPSSPSIGLKVGLRWPGALARPTSSTPRACRTSPGPSARSRRGG